MPCMRRVSNAACCLSLIAALVGVCACTRVEVVPPEPVFFAPAPPVVEFRGVTKSFGKGPKAFTAILDGADVAKTLADLDVQANKIHKESAP